MTMAAALGYALMEQSNAQGAMGVSREDNRRLDLIADTLSRKLVETPGFSALMAPIGIFGAYHQIPASLKLIPTNSQGVPFQYCPLAQVDQRGDAVAGTTTNITINVAGGTSYSVERADSGAAWDNAIYDPSVRAVSPIAIITSALKGSAVPPPCSAVKIVNGRALVANGIARVVAVPSQVSSAKQSSENQISYYVSQNGSGDKSGKDASNLATAEDAWQAIFKNRPATAVVYLNENIQTGTYFNNYMRSPVMRNTDLQIIGNGPIMSRTITLPTNVNWPIYGSVTLFNTAVSTLQMVVQPMGKLQLSDHVKILPSSPNIAPVMVEEGGQLTIKNAQVAFDYRGQTSQGAILNSGNVTVISSSLVGTGQPPHLIVTYTGGNTILEAADLGKTPYFGENRPFVNVYVQGTGRLAATNTRMIRGTSGKCWGSTPGEGEAFAWSADGPGTNMAVPSENRYVAPLRTDTPQVWATYHDGTASRRRAREQNVGGADCVENL